MAWSFLVIGLSIVFAVVVYLINYYGNRKASPWYVKLLVLIGWFFPFSIVLVLPLDITSSIYRNLSEEERLKTEPPIGYQSEEFFLIFWNITYWTTYVLTWLAFPLLSGYIQSGHYTPWKKFKDSIYQNFVYYSVLGIIGVVFIVYIAIVRKMTGQALLAFLMAMGNAWGLLLCVVFLGYGLISIPKSLWRKAKIQWLNCYYEFKAPRLKDASIEAEENLQKIAKKIFRVSYSISSQDPLRPYVDTLIELCPLTTYRNQYDEDEENEINASYINISYLAQLNYKLKSAIIANNRCTGQYNELLKKAYLVQDILDNENNPNKEIDSRFIVNPDSLFYSLKTKIAWRWYYSVRPYLFYGLSLLLALLSIIIIWSEVTFQLTEPNISLVYIYMKYSKYLSYLFFELIVVILLIYMCICTYTSLFQLKLFDLYHLFPNHHTDDNSLVFCASYLCRLTFPLCYNFINLADNTQTAFSSIMGNIDLVPLLGKEFNGYVPVMILLFTFISFFNFHGILLRKCGIDDYFGMEHFSLSNEDDLADIVDGKLLIEQARTQDDRLYQPRYVIGSAFKNKSKNKGKFFNIISTTAAPPPSSPLSHPPLSGGSSSIASSVKAGNSGKPKINPQRFVSSPVFSASPSSSLSPSSSSSSAFQKPHRSYFSNNTKASTPSSTNTNINPITPTHINSSPKPKTRMFGLNHKLNG